MARVSWKGDLSHWLKSLHDEYNNDIIRISPDELSTTAPLAWKDLYTHRQGHKTIPKDKILFGGTPDILTANDADHARMRRLIAHAFSDRALREQEPLIQSHIATLMCRFNEQVCGPAQGKVDLIPWYSWTIFDIIGDLSFGESFNCLRDSQFHPWVNLLRPFLKAVVLDSVVMRFPPLNSILQIFVPKKVAQARVDHIKMTTEKVNRRMEL